MCEDKSTYDLTVVMDSVFNIIRQHMNLCIEKIKLVQKLNSRKENILQPRLFTLNP